MSKFKKIILAVLVSCLAVCAGLAIAACTGKSGENFRKPKGFIGASEDFNGYTIYVKSVGGMNLDGVKVSARKGGTTVRSGISKNGIINLSIEPDIYQLVVDPESLPAGFYVDDTQYYTTPGENKVDILINSRVITSTAPSSKVYSVGDVIYDFAFTDSVTKSKLKLSELLNERTGYKAVILNFFYIGCVPCKLEFPAIEEAYKQYNQTVAIVALTYQDSIDAVENFAKENGYTFNMTYDQAGITSRFNASAFPTTVVVDRFGIIAERNEGSDADSSHWKEMFRYYTSDDYSQKPVTGGNPSDPTEFAKPDEGLVMPNSDSIAAVLTGDVNSNSSINSYYGEEGNDKEFSWPWTIKGSGKDAYLDASNTGTDNSFSTLYAEITLAAGDAISYEYLVTTEKDKDILYVFIDGAIVAQHSGDSEGWKENLGIYVANRAETVELAFMYYKNLNTSDNNDRASLRNLSIRPAKDIMDTVDLQTYLVNRMSFNKAYNYTLTGAYFTPEDSLVKNEKDGYYYYNGALVLADILGATYWSDKHLDAKTFVDPEGNNRATSLYQLSYWKMSNYETVAEEEDKTLKFDYLDKDQSALVVLEYYLQTFSDNDLVPVTDGLIEVLNAFVDAMYEKQSDMFVSGDEKYAGQWLEFCYYFEHCGDRHTPLPDGVEEGTDYPDSGCYETLDPVEGLIYDNAFTAHEGANKVNITKILNLNDGGGVKYRFVPDKTGVYLFYSEADTAGGVNPKLFIFSEDKKLLLVADNDMRYDSNIFSHVNDEYYAYIWLEAGKTYYVHGAMGVPGDTGSFIMNIEYKGMDTVSYLRFASTAEGMFTYDPETLVIYYLAVDVAVNPDDGLYYHYTDDYTFGSKIYIDFIHCNFLDRKGITLYQMIQNGEFNFKKNGGGDYTGIMTSYYEQAIKNDGELYGLVEANEELVNALSLICMKYTEEGLSSGAWEMFACYYEYIGDPSTL